MVSKYWLLSLMILKKMKKQLDKKVLYEIYCNLHRESYLDLEKYNDGYAKIEDFTIHELEHDIAKKLPALDRNYYKERKIKDVINYLQRKYDRKTGQVHRVSFLMKEEFWDWKSEFNKFKPKNFEIVLYQEGGIPSDRKKDLDNFVKYLDKKIMKIVWRGRRETAFSYIGMFFLIVFFIIIIFGRGCTSPGFFYDNIGG